MTKITQDDPRLATLDTWHSVKVRDQLHSDADIIKQPLNSQHADVTLTCWIHSSDGSINSWDRLVPHSSELISLCSRRRSRFISSQLPTIRLAALLMAWTQHVSTVMKYTRNQTDSAVHIKGNEIKASKQWSFVALFGDFSHFYSAPHSRICAPIPSWLMPITWPDQPLEEAEYAA